MKTILYVEDEATTCRMAEYYLEKAFPDYNLVVCGARSVVDERLKRAGVNLKDIAIVCTDGELCSSFGWEVVEDLRKKGYQGPALYTSTTTIPIEKRGLYAELNVEKVGKGLIETIRRYIRD